MTVMIYCKKKNIAKYLLLLIVFLACFYTLLRSKRICIVQSDARKFKHHVRIPVICCFVWVYLTILFH